MLKGYLLANMEDGEPRTKANELWRKRLRELDEQADDAELGLPQDVAAQPVLHQDPRAQEGRPPGGLGPHRHRVPPLAARRPRASRPDQPADLLRLRCHATSTSTAASTNGSSTPRKARLDPDSPLRFIRFNADPGFTLQDQLLLAPLRVDDEPDDHRQKLELVGRFTDILLAWRIWNFRATDYSTMQYAMFNVMRDIRGLDVADLPRRCTTTCSTSRRDLRQQRRPLRSPAEPGPAPQDPRSDHRPHHCCLGAGVELRRAHQRHEGEVRGRAHLGRPSRASHRRVQPREPTSPATATGSATCSCCPSSSTPATTTTPTRRSSRTTSARTSSRPASTR